MLHGPENMLAENCFGITGEICEKTPYVYGKVIIAQGEAFCRYQGGKEIAPYVDGGALCGKICRRRTWRKEWNLSTGTPHFSGENMGAVYSFGVEIGASYAAKNIPHVPYAQGNKEMYPIIQSRTTLVKDILNRYGHRQATSASEELRQQYMKTVW